MGTVLDTSVFVDLERAARVLTVGRGLEVVARRLEDMLGPDEDVAVASITASELLHGVHRATSEHRARREAFVEGVLETFPVLEFDLRAARAHARLAGVDVGAHDRLVAATAVATGWRVGSANVRHFAAVRGLEVVEISLRPGP